MEACPEVYPLTPVFRTSTVCCCRCSKSVRPEPGSRCFQKRTRFLSAESTVFRETGCVFLLLLFFWKSALRGAGGPVKENFTFTETDFAESLFSKGMRKGPSRHCFPGPPPQPGGRTCHLTPVEEAFDPPASHVVDGLCRLVSIARSAADNPKTPYCLVRFLRSNPSFQPAHFPLQGSADQPLFVNCPLPFC